MCVCVESQVVVSTNFNVRSSIFLFSQSKLLPNINVQSTPAWRLLMTSNVPILVASNQYQ